MNPHASGFTPIPTQWVGEILITGNVLNESIKAPLATYETPLFPSVNRGARVSRACGGIAVTLLDERMSRSVILEAQSAAEAQSALFAIEARLDDVKQVVESTGRFIRFLTLHHEIVGKLLFLRLECQTGDASGHNMVTKAADALLTWITEHIPSLKYASISGNYCTDKKASAVNGILGRGKNVVAEAVISREVCQKYLRTTPEKIHELNYRKNWVGGVMAGSVRSANAHFANMLLAFYLATGQDAANIIEGSQGMVYTEVLPDGLYFSCQLPNVIVGSVGNGKGQIAEIEEHLSALGCRVERQAGENAQRLAAICAAVVWCGELSLLAAQTNVGELMRSHLAIERAERRR
ncbi:MAG: hydroxymethylglutaryl-CoA reductase [Cardiobacteriaceae bacterium]|nr:hydroxymethylglutaryl-CoA reductase [Cardiobacteriaceae bacterium]